MPSAGQTTCLTKTHIAGMPEDPLSLSKGNALSKSNVGPKKPHPTVSPWAFEHNYVTPETVGQSKHRLKPSSPKLNSPTPVKPQAHQMAAADLQAVAQHLHGGVPTQKGQEAIPLPDLTWSDRRPFNCVCSLLPGEPNLKVGICGVN